MSVYELFDIAQAIVTRIDFHWGLFITIHMALFGGVIYVNRPLRRIEKVAALFVYMGFAIVNLLMMQSQIEQAHVVYVEIAKFSDDICCSDNQLVLRVSEELAAGRFEWSMITARVAHAVMFVLVMLSIIFDRALVSNSDEEGGN